MAINPDSSLIGQRTQLLGEGSRCVTPGDEYLHRWLDGALIAAEDWEQLPEQTRQELQACPRFDQLVAKLTAHKLLTDYQAARIKAGKTFGLILGNFRVLQRLGTGGMGVVYKAEHISMRRLAAIKVPHALGADETQLLARFRAEIRAVARLQHPNIVSAFDAGTVVSPDPDGPTLHYFVMEYVHGRNLDEWVQTEGALGVAQACDLAYQVAAALAEAHKHHLVHRDIKPANILVTPERQAKLLDFGLARIGRSRMTEPGTVLGTVDFMAPEQASDASTVDIRADIYSLGGTLFWALTGKLPFGQRSTLNEELIARLTQPAPTLRSVRPDLPLELEEVVARMMALEPDARYPTPQAVMRALLPFLGSESQILIPQQRLAGLAAAVPATGNRVLVVDDEAGMRALVTMLLHAEGLSCSEAANGIEALEILGGSRFDLVLLDVDMPGISGLEVLARLRDQVPIPHLKVMMMSGRVNTDEMAETLQAGADDYLTKPFSMVQLRSRVRAALRLKEAQDRSDALNKQLMALAAEQEKALHARDSDLFQARNALVLALAKLVEHRDAEQHAHLHRLQQYCRCLAEEAASQGPYTAQLDAGFIQLLEACAPLHDIGKVALPEYILLKPGKLTAEERLIMQTHTTIGADTLAEVARQHGFAQAFFQTAIDIVRHHHERWDGTGYPDRLVGEAIPLSARIVALADSYDALRSRRTHRPAFSHETTMQLIAQSTGQFDPHLLLSFQRCGEQLERIFRKSQS
ncbi:MAG: protein kinase [Planctomycetia bacterium]|nr:protein kinase [Planctomycetia bacterium]